MANADTTKFVTFAEQLADAAREITLPLFRSGSAVENKLAGDFDPVTEADRNAEQAIRDLIERHFPDHGILGEEFPEKETKGPYRWVLDPVDGTRAFICGVPTWTTLIALTHKDKPVIGVIDQPFIDERWTGSPEGTVHKRGARAQLANTSDVSTLTQARSSTTDPRAAPQGYFSKAETQTINNILEKSQVSRFSMDAYAYGLLAIGQLDLVIETSLKWHDAAALIPVVKGAGGTVRDWNSNPVTRHWDGSIVAATGEELMKKALQELK